MMMYKMKKSPFVRRFTALISVFCLILSLVPAFELPASASAASDAAMDQLENWGVLTGYPDGQMHPERMLTRAEYVAMVNRAYGYKDTGETPFTDVPETSWYADDIGIAYNAGYFKGIAETLAGPGNTLTREQAIVMLGRNMRLDPVAGEVTEFSDGRDFSSWSHGLSRAAAQRGIIGGYADGSFKPRNDITRGEMAIMLQRALGTLINQPGTHTLSDHYGTVTISSPNTVLKDTTIAGDLYITGGLELGDVTLDNVRVLGNIIVAGGGESQSGKESVILRNVEADTLLVDSMADQYVSLRAEGNTNISEALLRSNAYIQDRTRPGEGLLNITLDSPDPDASFTLSGNLETVVNKTPGSQLKIAMGTVDELTIDEHAVDSTLNLDINSTALTLNLDTAANVVGVGDIGKLIVNAPGAVVEMLPDEIEIRPGLTAEIAGETMDAVKAKESSSDPRLLAGYPKLKNIAPTSATALYSTNKAGTVYWAVSATTDGSISEDELIDPTEGNSSIVLGGSTPVPNANEEVSAALANLTPDSNYYLSAIMTDAHDRHSPVKVVSFKTPDNTVPAFVSGYPQVSMNEAISRTSIDENGDEYYDPNFHVQVSAMPNKTCQLYYALYPAGSVAPTGQQFRTGALGKTLRSGVEDVTKNDIAFIDFYDLDENTTYDLYLWLTDADGKLSSSVQKLTFTTVDGTSPQFQYDTPLVSGNPPATSIPTSVNVNENATVYWTAVKHGDDYIKNSDANAPTDSLQALLDYLEGQALHNTDSKRALDVFKRKVESGSSSVRSGSTRVTADRDTAINITGLKAETAYDLYFVAKDAAGNYSVVKVLENVRTLDVTPPTVTQSFTHPNEDEAKPLEPYADTDILLVFSEDVQHYPATTSPTGTPITLMSVANDPVALAELLESIIYIYNDSGLTPAKPVTMPNAETGYDRNNVPLDSNWVVNFRKATVKQDPDTGAVTVTLPTKTTDGKAVGALNLKSGATYHFEIRDVQDLATTPNRIRPIPYKLDPFRTVSAQVSLTEDVRVNELGLYSGGDDIIDMAFTMRPVSINVEKSMRWDLLLWSDTTVDYDLYWRERVDEETELAGNANPWVKIPVSGSANSFTDVGTGEAGYVGKSLFYHFNYQPVDDDDPTEFVTSLDAEKAYEFAIHFTKVGDETDRGKWNDTIYFHINVVTSMIPQALSRLSNAPSISETTYANSKENGSILEINNKNDLPGHEGFFTLYQEFSDSKPPEFTHYYPIFAVQDTAVEISVMTDRPGRVFYLIAPFSALDNSGNVIYKADYPPTFEDGGAFTHTTNSNGNLVGYHSGKEVPTSGNDGTESSPHQTQGDKVSHPTSSMVYSPSITSTRVKAGSIQSNSGGRAYTTVTGLDPSTSYLIYFVLESNGQRSQLPTVFQFITDTAFRPRITLLSQAAIANVTHVDRDKDIAALLNYALFDMTALNQTILWDKLSSHLANGKTLPESMQNLRVYEAIQQLDTNATDGESVFDRYAAVDFKRSVANLAAGTPTKERYYTSSAEVAEGRTIEIDTSSGEKPIITGNNYYMLVTARYTTTSANASGDSFAFRGASPVYATDDTPPKLVSITGTISKKEYDSSGNPLTTPTIEGTITFLFDKELYFFNNSDPLNRFPIHLYKPTTGTDTVVNGTTYRSVEALFNSIYGLTANTNSSNLGKRTNSITLTLSGNEQNPMVQFVNYIASETSKSRDDGMSLSLNLRNISDGLLTASDYTFIGPSDIWKSGQQINIRANVAPGPVQSISLDPTYIQLCTTKTSTLDKTAVVTVTSVPTNPTNKTITWTQTSSNGGRVSVQSSSQIGDPVSITAVTKGTVTLTATSANNKIATCTIEISDAPTPRIVVNPPLQTIIVSVGKTTNLQATIEDYYGSAAYSFEFNADFTGGGEFYPSIADPSGRFTLTGSVAGNARLYIKVKSSDTTLSSLSTLTIPVTIVSG